MAADFTQAFRGAHGVVSPLVLLVKR